VSDFIFTREHRKRLLEALESAHLFDTRAGRKLMLADLPRTLINSIERSDITRVDLFNIVQAAEEWGPLDDGIAALLVLIDNALHNIGGTPAGVLTDLRSELTAASTPPSIVPPISGRPTIADTPPTEMPTRVPVLTLATTSVLVPGPPVYVVTPLADVPPDHLDYSDIQCILSQGMMSPYPCGGPGEPCNASNDPYFRPSVDWEGTRGETAKLLVIAAGFDTPYTQQTFTDVPPTNPYWAYIECMHAHNLLTGYADGTFRWQNTITRGQFAKVLANTCGFNEQVAPSKQAFEDVPQSNAFWYFVEQLARRSIMSGYECGGPDEPCAPPWNRPYFRWRNAMNTVTRAEMARILARTFFPNCQPADTDDHHAD
jgi:hypothetical protein